MLGTFRNTSICEDVRDEVGNKKSLMGVFSGDLIVTEFPARLRVAFYAEYIPKDGTGEHELGISLSLGDVQAATTKIIVSSPPGQVAVLILPQGIAEFDAPGELVLRASCEGETAELLRKAIRLHD